MTTEHNQEREVLGCGLGLELGELERAQEVTGLFTLLREQNTTRLIPASQIPPRTIPDHA